MSVTPFTIHIAPETLTDLQERLARTRWTDEVTGAGREYGTNLAYLKDVEELGYKRFATRASDLGAGVSQQLALAHASRLIGIHHSGTNPYVGHIPDNLTKAKQEFVANAQQWNQQEMAYAMEHSSKPQTLASGLNDSPAGLAAWIIEKFRA
jgi:hypothetical protein